MTVVASATVDLPVYARVIGHAWPDLAEPIRRFHNPNPEVRAWGRLRFSCGQRWLARMIARLIGFPRPGLAVDTRLAVSRQQPPLGSAAEHWHRTFAGHTVATMMYQTAAGVLAERYALLEFQFTLSATDGSLIYSHRQTALMIGSRRWRLPDACAPYIEAREDPMDHHRININVRMTLPWLGPMVTYDGTITIEDRPV